MASFVGGSAPAMARQVCDGYTLVSAPMLKRLTVQQLDQLIFELDKSLRTTRSEPVNLDDQQTNAKRNRRISRIEGALRVIKASAQEKRRRGIRG